MGITKRSDVIFRQRWIFFRPTSDVVCSVVGMVFTAVRESLLELLSNTLGSEAETVVILTIIPCFTREINDCWGKLIIACELHNSGVDFIAIFISSTFFRF